MRTAGSFEAVELVIPVDHRQAGHTGLGAQIYSAAEVAEFAACSGL